MSNEEKILSILEQMQSDIKSMKSDINSMKSDIETLKEGQDEIRSSVNRLVEWADECGYVVKLPLPKI